MKSYIAAVEDAARSATGKMSSRLRRDARTSGWSPQAGRSLTVSQSGNSFSYSGNEDAAEAEFGGPNGQPSPVARTFAHGREPEQILMREISDLLAERGLV